MPEQLCYYCTLGSGKSLSYTSWSGAGLHKRVAKAAAMRWAGCKADAKLSHTSTQHT